MQNIYQETIKKVSEGSRFRVNLEYRSLRVDGRYIIKDGEYEGELGTEPVHNVLSAIERLYLRYKHSIPSERSDAQRKTYFRAFAEHELSDEDMLYGERRETAQVALELFILCSILNGSLVWDDFAKGKWFWKSSNAEGLILLKNWIINK